MVGGLEGWQTKPPTIQTSNHPHSSQIGFIKGDKKYSTIIISKKYLTNYLNG